MPIEITNNQLEALANGDFESGGLYIRVLGKALHTKDVITALAFECRDYYTEGSKKNEETKEIT
jgi:hypothetical protein